MPYCFLRYDKSRELNQIISNLASALPDIVAKHMSTSTSEGTPGYLTPKDIIVMPIPFSGGENGKDIEITIIAHQYPRRFRNLEERNMEIFKEVGLFLSDYDRNVSFFVWTLLAPSAFMSSSMLDQKTGDTNGLPRN